MVAIRWGVILCDGDPKTGINAGRKTGWGSIIHGVIRTTDLNPLTFFFLNFLSAKVFVSKGRETKKRLEFCTCTHKHLWRTKRQKGNKKCVMDRGWLGILVEEKCSWNWLFAVWGVRGSTLQFPKYFYYLTAPFWNTWLDESLSSFLLKGGKENVKAFCVSRRVTGFIWECSAPGMFVQANSFHV